LARSVDATWAAQGPQTAVRRPSDTLPSSLAVAATSATPWQQQQQQQQQQQAVHTSCLDVVCQLVQIVSPAGPQQQNITS
jgi:hypothetical protein